MITLCGFPVSNYYNKVKLALLEKNVPFVEETVMTKSTDEAVLSASPLAKIPFIRTEHGALSDMIRPELPFDEAERVAERDRNGHRRPDVDPDDGHPFDDIGGEYESPFATTSDEVTKDSDIDVVETPSTEQEVETPASGEVETETSTEEAETVETPETTEETTSTEEEEPKVEDKEAAEADAEARLADEKSPKWFKNAVNNVYKPKIDELSQQLAPFQSLTEQYGSVEDLQQKLDLVNKLETVRSNPQTGLPEKTTADFVQGLYQKDPQVAYQLINDLAQLPSPETQGYTVLQEMFKQVGIDPAKLNEVKAFAANGYLLQQGQYAPPDADELALIPEHLHATYSSLPP